MVWSSSSFRNQSISLNGSDYCFVNECTIRIKESNVLLNIINKTTDWIAATDSTDLFITAPVTSSHNNCSKEDGRDITSFIFFTVAIFVICTSSSLNIILHLVVKKLRSTSGLLIIGICGTIIIGCLCAIILSVFQYLHRVNGNTAICGVLKYLVISFIASYTTLKATYLFHFAYLMYRTYMSRPYEEKNKKLLYIYGTISVTVTTVCSVVIITADQLQYKNAFDTYNGYCAIYFFNNDGTSHYLYRKFLVLLLAIITAMGMVFLIIGLTLYFLTTKRCCACSGMTGPNDIRVSITLTSATALGILILVVLLLAGVNEDVSVMAASIGVCIEQAILLIAFLTSTKSRDKMKKFFQRKKSTTSNKHTVQISMQERYTANYIAIR